MAEDVNKRIDDIVKGHKVVLFMKGTAKMPQCGFSNTAIQILNRIGAPYTTVNVLEDYDIREGVKRYSDWPTIPQLFVGGEFVGGSDIAMELFESGELAKLITG